MTIQFCFKVASEVREVCASRPTTTPVVTSSATNPSIISHRRVRRMRREISTAARWAAMRLVSA